MGGATQPHREAAPSPSFYDGFQPSLIELEEAFRVPRVLDQVGIAAVHRLHRSGVSKSEIGDAPKVTRTTVRRALRI